MNISYFFNYEDLHPWVNDPDVVVDDPDVVVDGPDVVVNGVMVVMIVVK